MVDWNRGETPDSITPRKPTRQGKHWRQSNLRSILTKRTLLGETTAGVRGWDAILDETTFGRLQRLFADPARKVTHSPGVKSQKYSMGGGLRVCAKCEKPLITNTKRNADGSKRAVISCLARVHGPHAAHPKVEVTRADGSTVWRDKGRVSIDHDLLMEHVFSTLLESLASAHRFAAHLSEEDPAIQSEVAQLEGEPADLPDQRERGQCLQRGNPP